MSTVNRGGTQPNRPEITRSEYSAASWADRQVTGAPVQFREDRRPSEGRAVSIILAVSMLLLVVPLILFVHPTHHRNGMSARFPAWLLVWTATVLVGSVVALRRLARNRPLRPGRIVSREERALGFAPLLMAVLVVLVAPNLPGATRMWLWACCAALVVVLGARAFSRAPRENRQDIANGLFGAIAALCLLFPIDQIPRGQFRTLASILTPAVAIIMGILVLTSVARRHMANPRQNRRATG